MAIRVDAITRFQRTAVQSAREDTTGCQRIAAAAERNPGFGAIDAACTAVCNVFAVRAELVDVVLVGETVAVVVLAVAALRIGRAHGQHTARARLMAGAAASFARDLASTREVRAAAVAGTIALSRLAGITGRSRPTRVAARAAGFAADRAEAAAGELEAPRRSQRAAVAIAPACHAKPLGKRNAKAAARDAVPGVTDERHTRRGFCYEPAALRHRVSDALVASVLAIAAVLVVHIPTQRVPEILVDSSIPIVI
jgi:hypothetical protein